MQSKHCLKNLEENYEDVLCVENINLLFSSEKKLVSNYTFEINIKNTTARCEICSKLTMKIPKLLLLTLNMFFFLSSYLNFFRVDDLQKNWNLVYILKLA